MAEVTTTRRRPRKHASGQPTVPAGVRGNFVRIVECILTAGRTVELGIDCAGGKPSNLERLERANMQRLPKTTDTRTVAAGLAYLSRLLDSIEADKFTGRVTIQIVHGEMQPDAVLKSHHPIEV